MREPQALRNTHELERHLALAAQLQEAGELDAAADRYRKALAKDPTLLTALHNLAVIELAKHRFESASELTLRAECLGGGLPEIEALGHKLGYQLYLHGFWEQALPRLLDAQLHDPQNESLNAAIKRISLPDYLEPEVYCEARGETLRRYSPREGSSYIYAIDIVGTCNLRCPSCPVGNSRESSRAKGHMSLTLFEKILTKIKTECPAESPQLFFFNWGEPLLHPQVADFVRLAHRFFFPVTISSNLNVRSDFAALAQASPESIKVSLSGFSDETYEQTHAQGRVDLVLENLRTLSVALKKNNSSTVVHVGHHLYRHNLHEQDAAAALCAELGFIYAPVQAFFQPLEKLKLAIEGHINSDTLPVLDLLQLSPRDRAEKLRAARGDNYDCELRFNQTVINHDGSVALCCGVYESENMLGMHFLEHSHQDLEREKYRHSFCATCKKYEMDYSPTSPQDPR